MAVGNIRTRVCAVLTAIGASALIAAAPAGASPLDPSGVIKIIRSAHAHLNANQSTNWFGYNQGSLEQGGKLFHSITGDWTVPTAAQHARGEAESSATWIGIGGGCVDAGCSVTDPTGLIQAGTEQDVDSTGSPSYSAWWELVPVPAVTISNMAVGAGDHMHASVAEALAGLWTITLQDLTRHETFTITVPYASSQASAEWIEETPLTIGAGGTGLAALPRLTETPFTAATANGSPAGLKSSEALDLFSGTQQIGTPSAPAPGAAGFGACAWTTSCPVPGTVAAKARPHAASSHRSKAHRKRHKSRATKRKSHKKPRRRR